MKQKNNLAHKQDDTFPLKPCAYCGEIMLRRVYRGRRETHAKYMGRTYCSQKCYVTSRQPPPKDCEFCGKVLIRRENELIGDWKLRKFCNKSCANKAMAKTAARKRLEKLQRAKCTVYGCNNFVAENNRYLCQECFENHEQIWENAIGEIPNRETLSNKKVNAIIEKIRKKLEPRILVFTWAEYKQDELEFYLMTPAQRREARRNYERQARSKR